MSGRRILAIVLVVIGCVVLAYSGLTFRTPGKPINLGPLHVETTRSHFIPPAGGAIMLAVGIVLLATGREGVIGRP